MFGSRFARATLVVLLILAMSALLFVAHRVRMGAATQYELADAPLVMRAIDAETTVADLEDLLATTPDLIMQRDPNGNMLIHHAVMKGRIEVVEALLDHGADVNARGMVGTPPVMFAIRERRQDVVALLLERGADPEIGVPGRTALDEARTSGDPAIVQLLEAAAERQDD